MDRDKPTNRSSFRDHEGREVPVATPEEIQRAAAEYDAMRPVQEQLPQGVPGGFLFGELAVLCDRCGCPCTEARGKFTNPLKHVMCAELLGYCEPCKCMTRGRLRLHHRIGQEPLVATYTRGRWVQGTLSEARMTLWKRLKLWWVIATQRSLLG